MGNLRVKLVAVYPRRLDIWHVHRRHRPYHHSLRLLRRVRMRPKHILHHLQSRPLHSRNTLINLPASARSQSEIRPRSSIHGYRILHVPHGLRSSEPQRRNARGM